MQFRPSSFEMVEGSINKLIIKFGNLVGSGSVTGTPTLDGDGLTFASTAISGSTLTSLVSGGTADRNYIVTVTAVLSTGETKVGAIELQWKQPGYEFRAGAR